MHRSFLPVLTISIGMLTHTASAQQQASEAMQLLRQREQTAPKHIKRELQELRAALRSKGTQFEVGYTEAMDLPLESLFGEFEDPNETPAVRRALNRRANEQMEIDRAAWAAFIQANPQSQVPAPDDAGARFGCKADLPSFSWRDYGMVTDVRRQKCGNCWAFAAAGALEPAT